MPAPANTNDELNLAAMSRSLFRSLGLHELSDRDLARTRVFRNWNAQADEYDYAVQRPGTRPRIVTTREIVDASEQRQQQRAARERAMEMESMRRMTVNLRPPPSGIRELRIEPGQGESFTTTYSNAHARLMEEGERIRQQAAERMARQLNNTPWESASWINAGQVEPELPPVPRSVPRWPSMRFSLDEAHTEVEVRQVIGRMNNEIYSLLSADHQIAALVVKPDLIRSIKHHLRHEVFVRMEPLRMPVGEFVDTAIAPVSMQQRVISSEPDMLLGYRLVADDAADPYWIVVKPRR